MEFILLEKEYAVVCEKNENLEKLEENLILDMAKVLPRSRKNTNCIMKIDVDEIENKMICKKVAKRIINCISQYKRQEITLGCKINGKKVIAYLVGEKTETTEVLLEVLKAACYETRKQYEYIYDTVCKQLDKAFQENDYCEFCGNSCIGNRSGCTRDSVNGCCYSFQYDVKTMEIGNRQLCKHLVNKQCDTSCISCKLHTCNYLRKKGVSFKIQDILLLDCFFSKKQKEILKVNFFRTREQIINKLLEKNRVPHWLYYMKDMARIKNPDE